MKEKLSSVLTRKVLLRQAGEIYFARGEKYYRAGNVKKVDFCGSPQKLDNAVLPKNWTMRFSPKTGQLEKV